VSDLRVLNLYAGLGGNRKLWTGVDVTAIESNPKIAAVYSRLYPNDTVIVGDAHEYLLKHYEEFDFIWSSPPCPSHSKMMKFTRHKLARYPDFKMYEEIVFLKNFFKGKFVVENVVPYYKPLMPPDLRVGRHLFWSNFYIYARDVPAPKNFINLANLKGKKAMQDWLGIHFEENIYLNGNHCPAQVLRNCVHPQIGLDIFKGQFFVSARAPCAIMEAENG